MNITFYGAARSVTGSCHLVDACGKKFLIDCGMFQGKLTDQILNYEDFPFDINSIDFVVLTHAHMIIVGEYQSYINKVIQELYMQQVLL